MFSFHRKGDQEKEEEDDGDEGLEGAMMACRSQAKARPLCLRGRMTREEVPAPHFLLWVYWEVNNNSHYSAPVKLTLLTQHCNPNGHVQFSAAGEKAEIRDLSTGT